MNVLRFGLALCALVCLPRDAAAVTTNLGQSWTFEPDAWTRANDGDTSWFGWDTLENTHPAVPPLGGAFRILDDNSADVGGVTTAVGTRIFQGNDGQGDPSPTTSGHRSSSGMPSGNYYSGFNSGDVANDTITATAPASGMGGSTTVVLQVLGQPGQAVADLEFTMDGAWTQVKDLYAINAGGAGMYWQEWTAPGNDLPLSIKMTSTESSRAIDAFQVDTFWTPSDIPVVNSIAAIPEPASVALAGIALLGTLFVLRKRRVA